MQNLASRLFGRPRDLRDPKVFHQMSLVAFLAWVGLGADGLSSSSYGPEEAFKALGHFEPDGCYGAAGNLPCAFLPDFGYLAVFLAVAIAATVFIISWGYRRIIEEFRTAAAATSSQASTSGRTSARCRARRCWSTTS